MWHRARENRALADAANECHPMCNNTHQATNEHEMECAGSQSGGRGGSRAGNRRSRVPSLSERVQTQADGSQDVFV